VRETSGKLLSRGSSRSFEGLSINSRDMKNKDIFLCLKGPNFDGHDFIFQAVDKGAKCVIMEEGKVKLHNGFKIKTNKKDITFISVKDTVSALAGLANFHRRKFGIPVIAVTGSSGKTTTKDMISCVLSSKYKVLSNEGTKNNHIGLPMTLLQLNNKHDAAVLEMGTNNFGEISYLSKIAEPNIGLITNIGAAHLEAFVDLDGVFREKYALVDNLTKPYVCLLNTDDGILRKKLRHAGNNPFVIGFGIKEKSDFVASSIKVCKGRINFSINKKNKISLRTIGLHNVYNALAAAAVARVFGLGYRDISSRLKDFIFPGGRLKLIKAMNTNIIDDTYNSNPLSLSSALKALESYKTCGRKIVIMGDMLELGLNGKEYHMQAVIHAMDICDVLITVGELSGQAGIHFKSSKNVPQSIFSCGSVSEARDLLVNKIYPCRKDIVLIKGSRRIGMENIFNNKDF